jgi:hypothetical protein
MTVSCGWVIDSQVTSVVNASLRKLQDSILRIHTPVGNSNKVAQDLPSVKLRT